MRLALDHPAAKLKVTLIASGAQLRLALDHPAAKLAR